MPEPLAAMARQRVIPLALLDELEHQLAQGMTPEQESYWRECLEQLPALP